MNQEAKPQFLRLPQVIDRIPVGRSTWWLWCAQGKAPKPIQLSPRVTVWRSEDIDAFIQQQGASGE